MTGKKAKTFSARDEVRPPRPKNHTITKKSARRIKKIITSKKIPTIEEVANLKREKHNLLQEKSLLRAKIGRLVDITKHPDRYNPRQSTDQNSLEKEHKQIEQLSAAKRAEIATLKCSDLAASVNELQEECLMLYMELVRVKHEKIQTDKDLRRITRQLEEAEFQYRPDLEKKQERIIRDLNNQIYEQTMRNKKIKDKITDRENQILDNQRDETSLLVQKTISDLEQKIKSEQEEIYRIDEEMKQFEEDKKKEIAELQRKLSQL